jgi:hypothetical protein
VEHRQGKNAFMALPALSFTRRAGYTRCPPGEAGPFNQSMHIQCY